jgi:hypothetical protein
MHIVPGAEFDLARSSGFRDVVVGSRTVSMKTNPRGRTLRSQTITNGALWLLHASVAAIWNALEGEAGLVQSVCGSGSPDPGRQMHVVLSSMRLRHQAPYLFILGCGMLPCDNFSYRTLPLRRMNPS